ncbi:hypothetical protein VTK56DRAFT_2808 [Thermocarpiscus australiensis]
MSSPSQFAGPREPPVSGLPTSAPSSRQEAFKMFGQGYQYAETLQNPLPEMVVSHARTSQTNIGVSQFDSGSSSIEGNGQHDAPFPHRSDTVGSKESAMREAVWVEPPEEPWYRKISNLGWLIIAVTVLGIAGVVLAILGAMGIFSHGHSGSDVQVPSPTAKISTTASPSATSTSAFARPTGAGTRISCTDPSTFINDTLWIGTEVGSYTGQFSQAKSPGSCCDLCFGRAPGCAGWLYNASSTFTPCTMIVVSADKPRPDDKCPKGYAPTTFFALGEDGVAGLGPCSEKADIQ